MHDWPSRITDLITLETHFGREGLKCFADRPANLNQMLQQAVTRNGQGEAVVCDDVRLTYDAFHAQVRAVAAGMAAHGVQQGDCVALVLGNAPEFLIALMATLHLGAIAVPINVREGTPELAHILNDCGAVLVVHDTDVAAKLPAADAVPQVSNRFCVGGAVDGSQDYAALSTQGALTDAAHVNPEDTAVILYTSGTTGQPKGAMLAHLNIIHSTMHFEMCMELGARERSLLAVPASHVTGLVATLFTMLRTAGCSVILRSFRADTFLELAAREKVTQTLMVPAMYNLFLLRCNVADYDLSQWRIGGYGGAPMAHSTIAELAQKLPNLALVNAYGATEVSSPATIMPLGQGHIRADSVGHAVPCAEIRIVDETGHDVATGEHGELWIKGPMVVPGYWNNPEKTAAEFHDGFWKSGDVGSRDADGFIQLHDRRKDMIIRGGYNIFSAEVENALTAHPAVIECAAIGRPDPVLGEKMQVFVHSSDPNLDAETIKAFCAARLADYKTPDFVTFSAEPLPRNANGKIVKKALRDMV
ncbi:Acyl-CoA synthetase (AMP-forming)/AMP-acid ligase II [Pseudosulfitobacter pseudonitzschiae]|uniref:O-succinylbenzoic acid--CoA ligase n=1 Tax=Pseudosulfitobacter pseudonitzschiae TaxID=1402135 RepID=A0A073J462_9RHOB|nr:class I adenylate-forming enzyme family protein [Pseudosulfitobacter pseudonitzschiae]KEJ96471.1 O-succinylbenzoic acid--CoA ligase [Pseudosulfitobacter pseudonitzschiae]QKS08057.1 acyl--CoA ligase [Pseudosulfitobacter pseudonitzschiae]SHF33792.1 Acyl-CoA synthetase (AMP-forming)/AMP-acid ligase II [Pseudosulfitobacter pseudonitzschiae]